MMDKRVYGVLGIKSIMSNWNADFTGYPKSISTGEVFGSDKAFKYPIKKMWDNQGENVLYIKSYKIDESEKQGTVIRPKSLSERYEQIFNEKVLKDKKDKKDNKKVLENLFKAIDVKNFGATFAEEGNNISITGAVQITQGFNKYDGHNVEEQQILSPFRNSKNKKDKVTKEEQEDNSSTLGSKIVSNEAHYFYGFTINPLVYKEYEDLGATDGYSEEDYNKFKYASLVAATSFNTNSKVGCENELGIFIETEKDLYLPDMTQFVEFIKGKNISTVKLNFKNLINDLKDKIKSIEIYYNPYTTEIEGKIEGAKYFNIFTKKGI